MIFNGAEPEVAETVKSEVGGVLVCDELGMEKAKGDECGLCVPLLKDTARVKLAVLVSMETRQSIEVAAGFDVWQASCPSW